MKIKFHPSSVGRLMTDDTDTSITVKQLETLYELEYKPKRTDKQQVTLDQLIAKRDAPPQLSTGAKTYVRELVDAKLYKYKEDVYAKPMDKGTTCEQDSIDYLNSILFTSYEKFPEGEYSNDHLESRGCDIKQSDIVRDIKSSWTKKSHPKTWQDANSSLYDWQLRAYMNLFACKLAYLDFVLVNTPDELIGFDNESLHIMDDLTAKQRHTSIRYEHCPILEAKMIRNIELAWTYADEYIETLTQTSNY